MLIGRYVILRIIEKKDIELVREWRNHPDNYSYFANRDFIADFQQEDWFVSKSNSKTDIRLMIIEKENGHSIGIIHLESIDLRNRNACWGIYIGNTRYRKRVYAVEAVLLMFEYAYNYLNLFKIYGNTLEGNSRGREFHKFVGFQEDAIFKKHIFVDGQYTDLIWISLFLNEWMANNYNNLKNFVINFNIENNEDNET